MNHSTLESRTQAVLAIEQLADRLTELAAHLDAGEYRFLVLLEEFDRLGACDRLGLPSCARWLNWKCGLSLGVAREKVRVARALPTLPQISRAFSEGRISYSKVRAMTRVATAQNEEALLDVALHGTASHVEKQVQLYRRVKRIEALQQENQRHAHRELAWGVDDDGYWTFRGRFTPEQGAVIAKALEVALEDLFSPPGDETPVGAGHAGDKEASVPFHPARRHRHAPRPRRTFPRERRAVAGTQPRERPGDHAHYPGAEMAR